MAIYKCFTTHLFTYLLRLLTY